MPSSTSSHFIIVIAGNTAESIRHTCKPSQVSPCLGKLKPRRHPVNHYRLHRRDELETVLRSVKERRQSHG